MIELKAYRLPDNNICPYMTIKLSYFKKIYFYHHKYFSWNYLIDINNHIISSYNTGNGKEDISRYMPDYMSTTDYDYRITNTKLYKFPVLETGFKYIRVENDFITLYHKGGFFIIMGMSNGRHEFICKKISNRNDIL